MLLERQKEELSEFAHTMSHDLHNRLLSMEGYAEILESEYDASYAQRIRHLAQGTNDLLRRSIVLADAGQIIAKTDEVNLAQLIQETAKNSIPQTISFLQDELPTVMGDSEKLSQVFQNLFENAVIHGKPHKIEVRRKDGENSTTVLITNDGAPIPHEIRLRIFQRGFTTMEGSSGLGMAIVKKIIDAHGWQISLAATMQTTFQIVIPTKSLP